MNKLSHYEYMERLHIYVRRKSDVKVLDYVNLFYYLGWFGVIVTAIFLITDFSETIVGAKRVGITFFFIWLYRRYLLSRVEFWEQKLNQLNQPQPPKPSKKNTIYLTKKPL
jgi:hypothetical protein